MIVIDTGPIWSFAHLGRLDLLGGRLEGRVLWTTGVQEEATASRNIQKEPGLAQVASQGWLPEPIDMSELGHLAEVMHVRRSMAAPDDHPLQHLGEAEAIVYANNYGCTAFLTEDSGALGRARFHRITTMRTTDLMAELVAMYEQTEGQAWELCERLQAEGRLPRELKPSDVFR